MYPNLVRCPDFGSLKKAFWVAKGVLFMAVSSFQLLRLHCTR